MPEVPCAQCGRRVPGLAWGERCPDCLRERRRRASRLAGWVALGATILAAIYVAVQRPSTPTARYYGALAVVVTYVVVRRIVQRVAMEILQ